MRILRSSLNRLLGNYKEFELFYCDPNTKSDFNIIYSYNDKIINFPRKEIISKKNYFNELTRRIVRYFGYNEL